MKSRSLFVKAVKHINKYTGFVYQLDKTLTFKQRINYFRVTYSSWRKTKTTKGKPIMLTIEPTNYCNLGCPICETGNNTLGRNSGFLSLKKFKKIIDQFDSNLKLIYFYFMGEPFMNKSSYEMIRYAADRGISVESCTNGDLVNPELLVKSGITAIDFQVGGNTQEIHERYRANSKIDKVKKNLEETIRLRDKYGVKLKIVSGYILMKHNEHELEDYIKYCNSIGVDYVNIIGTTARTVVEARTFMPLNEKYQVFDKEKLEEGILTPKIRPNNYCGAIYSSIAIHVNGDVVPCCHDPKGKHVLGNIFDDGLDTIWNGKKYQELRKLVTTRSNKLDLCRICEGGNIPILHSNKVSQY